MAEKPRVKAPKKRDAQKAGSGSQLDRRLLFSAGGIIAVALVVAAGGFFLLSGGSAPSATGVRTDLEAAGCTLQAVKALKGTHTLDPGRDGELEHRPSDERTALRLQPERITGHDHLGRVHGARPARARPPQPRARRHLHLLRRQGLGGHGRRAPVRSTTTTRPGPSSRRIRSSEDKIALGAWVCRRGQSDTGYLAKCPTFDEGAFAAFFERLPVQGPRALSPASSLLPGGSSLRPAPRLRPPGWRNG